MRLPRSLARAVQRLGGRPIDARHALGARGEREAARYLKRHGFRVLARDREAAGVQIDLLCLEKATGALVVVEVKSSTPHPSRPATHPERALTREQLARLHRAATALARANQRAGKPVRVDLVLVAFPEGGKPVVTHRPGRPLR